VSDIEGVDYSTDHPSASGLAAVGKRFAGRYIGPGSTGKQLTDHEISDLVAHGIAIVSLVEGIESAALGGRPVGVKHATSAQNAAEILNMPPHRPYYFAVDFDVTAEQWPAVREYLRGAASVVGDRWVGVYGSYQCMVWAHRDRVAAWYFQTFAWSHGRWFSGNHLEQYRNSVSLVGGNVDLDRAMVPDYGQWVPGGIPQQPPGGDMQQSDKLVRDTNNPDRTVGDVFGDIENLRNYLIDPPGTAGPLDPPVGSVLDVMLRAAQVVLTKLDAVELAALTAAVERLMAAPLVDAVQVANAMATNPDILDALTRGVADRLGILVGEITLSGGLRGRVEPPAQPAAG
jgi:Domain of unknown function (DUF1906)